ncbi:APC family permease [Cryobacterium glaciale]|uniref:APC family permease n=1 Tax=Cryobacterium glaciale TaxID=1259145 RepID=A0A4R8USP8_9MICO|nr:APC family permease [Cryobacterium glaciale]TFB70633.1 APC family permease [Cryobacterium glaciale]
MTALQRAIRHPEPVWGFADRSPVDGLDRRSLGFLDVLAQSVSAVAPSAAATTIPLLIASAGGAPVWALASGMLIALLVASTVNQFTKRIAATGSLYTFVSRGLGRTASFVTGVALLVGYGFISMFALAGAGYYLQILLGDRWPALSTPLAAGVLIVAMAVLCVLVLARGIRVSTRVTLLVESVSVLIILVLVGTLLYQNGSTVDWSVLSLAGSTPATFAVGAALALTAYVGFESASTLGVEARRPFATIPRAIFRTVIMAGLLYLVASFSQVVGFAGLGRGISSSTSPVNDLAAAYGIGGLGHLLDVSIAASFLACAIASITALVRVLFSMGREGLLPSAFGRTHARYRTPFVAVVVAVPVLTAALIVTIAISGGVWRAMEILIVGAAGGYLTAYMLACLAAPVFLQRIGELTVWPLMRAGAAAVLLSVVLVVYLVSESTTDRYPGVWVFLAVMLLGITLYLVRHLRRPWLRHMVGIYDVPVGADVLGAVDAFDTAPSRQADVPPRLGRPAAES